MSWLCLPSGPRNRGAAPRTTAVRSHKCEVRHCIFYVRGDSQVATAIPRRVPLPPIIPSRTGQGRTDVSRAALITKGFLVRLLILSSRNGNPCVTRIRVPDFASGEIGHIDLGIFCSVIPVTEARFRRNALRWKNDFGIWRSCHPKPSGQGSIR